MIAIVSVVAAIAVVGGCVCYRNKQNSENEGGAKEDKKLFKKVFKGRSKRKPPRKRWYHLSPSHKKRLSDRILVNKYFFIN